MKKITLGVLLIAVIASGAAYYKYRQATSGFIALTDENLAVMSAETAAQNEAAFFQPPPRGLQLQAPNADKNLYFGDLHVHSSLSFDSYLFGNRNDLDQAYAFAQGEPLTTLAGEALQLSRPLDFVAITDHAETFWMMDVCFNGTDLPRAVSEFCAGFDNPSLGFFMTAMSLGVDRPLQIPDFLCELIDGECTARQAIDQGRPMWELIKAKAEQYNRPGVFTAFAGYEYSPPLAGTGKLHRNVIFRNQHTSTYAYSAFDARTAPILWQMLEDECTDDCEFLTIPHNLNKTWGLAYGRQTIDGDAYQREDWQRRARYEPLIELYQIKGNSECAIGINTTDEECAFEQFFPVCAEGESQGCIHPTSMARDGLKSGLKMQKDIGINPFQQGFIGATDNHNGSPGDTEEYDYRGSVGLFTSPAAKRLAPKLTNRMPMLRSPGGLAGVWAVENTRDALFDSMQQREAYATSGSRIRLRFFAGDGYTEQMLNSPRGIASGYAQGVPMGGQLSVSAGVQPTFMARAEMDPMTVPLDRLQVVKGWIDSGQSYEKITDVACSDGRVPDGEGRCDQLIAPVDLSNCQPASDRGAAELSAVWTDPDYNPALEAFYYVRVLEIPTCRWSTYDALRLGREPPAIVWPTHSERAWSSPIWLTAPPKAGPAAQADIEPGGSSSKKDN